eukprot:8507190-Karenia_brevis.AAC.1
MKLFGLPPALQAPVKLQGSLTKPHIFQNATAVLHAGISKALAGDHAAVTKFCALEPQEHIAWSFMQLTPVGQRQ